MVSQTFTRSGETRQFVDVPHRGALNPSPNVPNLRLGVIDPDISRKAIAAGIPGRAAKRLDDEIMEGPRIFIQQGLFAAEIGESH